MAHKTVLEQLRRRPKSDEYELIRTEWKTHSIAEDKRDIAGLMSTLTDDCVYELPQTGDVWRGKAGATQFYEELLGAFPDIDFDLQNIVIGPQGVFEEAHATGTHQGTWLKHPPSNNKIEFDVTIFFPWDPEKTKFKGERIYYFGLPE